ncbi:MAG: NAD-dependent epimerase/dehydratase family protein [Acidimicrobiia bacterium]
MRDRESEGLGRMRIVVTGAAGFLGRHVARRFRDSGWQVTGFDQHPIDEPGIKSVRGDLLDPDSVAETISKASHVAHIGAIGDVYLAGENPALAASVNVVGTANVLAAAERFNSRVIYASTWEVYGEPERQPIDEDHPTRPDHPYNITKLAGESLVISRAELSGLSTIALRLGTAYGPGLRPNSVFRIFIDRARLGQPITIQGDGSQGRQFTNANDISRAFEIAASSDVSGVPINIVAPEVVTIRELADTIIERFPTSVEYGDPRPGDVPPALVSADRAGDLLEWKAEVPFNVGLTELVDSVLADG